MGWSDNTGAMRVSCHRVRTRRVSLMIIVTCVLGFGLAACSSSDSAFCGPEESIGVVASAIAIGQYEFDETDGGSALRLAITASLNQLEKVTDEATSELASQARIVKDYFETFLNASDELLWDDALMSSDVRIDAVVAGLNSDEGVYATTAVNSYIANECDEETSGSFGVDEGLPTLPPPPISLPTATDPPIEMLDVDNEARALGETIAALFGLEVESEVALCLGRSLSDVAVRSGQSSAEYQAQFQVAFDACGLDYTIPVDSPTDAQITEE